jgi:hypothetical protein
MQIVPKKTTPIRQLLEKSMRFWLWKLWAGELLDLLMHSMAHPYTVHYSSDARIDCFIDVVRTATGMGMSIAPLWVLAYAGII